MLLIIDAELTAPPSEVTLFRDITLYSNIFLKKNVVLECKKSDRDFYYKWLREKAAWDYVEDFIQPKTEGGIAIRIESGNIVVPRINYYNFGEIINKLSIYKSDNSLS